MEAIATSDNFKLAIEYGFEAITAFGVNGFHFWFALYYFME